MPFLLIGAVAQAFGGELIFEDVGDAFTKGEVVLDYADEKVRYLASPSTEDLPEPPLIFGDPVTARTAWVFAAINALLVVTAVVVGIGRSPREISRRLGLGSYSFERLWLPAVIALGCYALIVGYDLAMQAIDIDLLEPQDRALAATARDDWALLLFGLTAVIGAPVAEEMLFRGLVFGGLLGRAGFWPAALASSFGFSLAHFDPGTILPFMGIGVAMAWLFRHTGSLWDSIAFHALFNAVSLAVLIAQRP